MVHDSIGRALRLAKTEPCWYRTRREVRCCGTKVFELTENVAGGSSD